MRPDGILNSQTDASTRFRTTRRGRPPADRLADLRKTLAPYAAMAAASGAGESVGPRPPTPHNWALAITSAHPRRSRQRAPTRQLHARLQVKTGARGQPPHRMERTGLRTPLRHDCRHQRRPCADRATFVRARAVRQGEFGHRGARVARRAFCGGADHGTPLVGHWFDRSRSTRPATSEKISPDCSLPRKSQSSCRRSPAGRTCRPRSIARASQALSRTLRPAPPWREAARTSPCWGRGDPGDRSTTSSGLARLFAGTTRPRSHQGSP